MFRFNPLICNRFKGRHAVIVQLQYTVHSATVQLNSVVMGICYNVQMLQSATEIGGEVKVQMLQFADARECN